MRFNFSFSLFYRKIILLLLVSVSFLTNPSCHSSERAELPEFIYASYDPRLAEWLVDYLSTLTDDTSIDDAVYAILEYRQALISQGYTIPPVSQLMPYFREILKMRGIHVEEDMFQFLQWKFVECETELGYEKPTILTQCKHHKKDKKKHKKEKEWNFSFTKKSVFGLIKVIGGTLTMLVPGCQQVGVVLVSNGFEDLINDCRDSIIDEKEKEKQRLDRALEAAGCP